MSSSTRPLVVCALGVITAACTALTGADDLTTIDQGQSASNADPEQNAGRGGGSGTRPASDAGAKETSPPTTPTTPASTPPPPPPTPIDAGLPTLTSIGCGQQTCAGATPHCCAAVGSYTCVNAATPCVGTRYRLTCDSPEDCTNGDVCCAFFGDNEGSRCVPAANCKVPTNIYARMCTANSHCPTGQACADYIVDATNQRLDIPSGLCTYN
jgi:hypothetical protein